MPAKFRLTPTQIEQTKLFSFYHIYQPNCFLPLGLGTGPSTGREDLVTSLHLNCPVCRMQLYVRIRLHLFNCATLTKIYGCSMHAAYVLPLELHIGRLHICAAYAWVHACSMWVGRHKLVLRAPRFSGYVQHTSARMRICVTWMQHARIWPKDASSMCAAFL